MHFVHLESPVSKGSRENGLLSVLFAIKGKPALICEVLAALCAIEGTSVT
ncbi:hypothetical protein GCM10010913_43430 [Paenibacillus aceti]|uniref:Uncharacterized protein n=1 Tax=Paenibacillus aceti TaxID=1820010 RepID=A0ABQ1W602_9BACL|nr:hypothetical protein GCM10010913_43430 [Paenibacillus aceti]